MKNIIIIPAIVLGVAMTSCTDYFLDLKPLDSQTEANYYKTAQQFEAAANGTYSFYGYKKISEKVNGKDCAHDFGWVWDSNTDLLAGVSNTANGTLAASENDGYWGLCYAKIRKCNILLEKAEQYTGTESIEPYVATAKFFRAYQYYWMLMRFGGVPIVTRPLSSTSDELYMARNSRYEVVSQIIADLRDAIAGLPDESAYDGHVTRQGAQAFMARVLLFEASWEKYVGDSTDGDGINYGAGSAKPEGYPSVSAMLTEAASLAETVINSGFYQLWEAKGTPYESIAYNFLFNLEDENTNPMGFPKDRNHEFILKDCYDRTGNRTGSNITHTFGGDNNGLGAVTLNWINMVPCVSDGLPYFYSEDYRGFDKMTDIYENRDYRFTSTVKKPGCKYYMMGTLGGNKDRYAKADYATCFDFPDGVVDYYPSVTSAGVTGFQNRKMISECSLAQKDGDEAYDYPILRLAELYLIYAEAKCELGNGQISDQDLDKSINVLHVRGGSAPISNASLAKANQNYLKNTGKPGNLTMLELIRNERAVELRNEYARQTDLLRWAIAEETINTNRLGVVIKNPDGTDTEIVNFRYYSGDTPQPTYTSASNIYGEEILPDGSAALIVNAKSQFNMKRHNYLYPLPISQLQLNENLLQNPGY